MALCSQSCSLLIAIMLLLGLDMSCLQAMLENGNKIKSATFLSPKFVLGPGSVENRYYYNIDFPRGHIALKSFNAEVIDDAGNPIPLHETYLHHWVVAKYYQRGNAIITETNHEQKFSQSDHIFSSNSGICQGHVLRQYFGLGSETRKTATHVPDPYGIEIGNPAEIPAGYEERWLLNVHAIDTRGVVDKLGCTECRCDLYNITVDEYGRAIRPDYKGGLLCCYDQARCKLRPGFEDVRRSLYLRYTVKWVDMDSSIIPVKIFIFDVTDNGKRIDGSTGVELANGCQVEYDVQPCSATGEAVDGCIDIKRTSLTMPSSGYVIYGVAHQHSGGMGSTLYSEDGRAICPSTAIYGEGKEPGDEAGYIVGMTTCYPIPGSAKIAAGENLLLESKYNSSRYHTGVMGIFYILVAEETPKSMPFLVAAHNIQESLKLSTYAWLIAVLSGVAITIAVAAHLWLRKKREDGYEPIMA